MTEIIIRKRYIYFSGIKSREIKISLPSSWIEMKERHLIAYAMSVTSELTPLHRMYVFLAELLGIGENLFRSFTHAQVDDLAKELKFITEEKNNISQCLIRSIRPKYSLIKYYGPAAGLGDLKTLELAKAGDFMAAYHNTKDVTHLNKLVAVLYRPTNIYVRMAKKISGRDLRIHFNGDSVDNRARIMARLPFHVKEAVKLNFIGYLNTLEACTPNIPRSAQSNPYGWMRIIYDLAGPVLGTTDKVEEKYALDAWMWLDGECYNRQSKEPSANTVNKIDGNANAEINKAKVNAA